jgi:hypothetical protein
MARRAGVTWRMTADGLVWLGVNAWPTKTYDATVLDDDTARGRLLLSSQDPTITAGVVAFGRRLTYVVHSFGEGRVRTEAWYDQA